MHDRMTPDEKRSLGQRLRQAASAARPEFSEALHRRICRAIETGAVRPRRSRPGRRRLFRAAAAVAAAACAVLLAVTLWMGPPERSAAPGRAGPLADRGAFPARADVAPTAIDASEEAVGLAAICDLADRAGGQFSLLVDSALDRLRWAELDRDARRTADVVGQRFPFNAAWTLAWSEISPSAGTAAEQGSVFFGQEREELP
jgi:hypothetical protein